jgi:two-component system OmpR family response regulator
MAPRDRSGRRFFTTTEVAEYCAVSNDGVLRWIKAGRLRAFTTPGGHYRVSAEDFRDFLQRHDIPIDERVFSEHGRSRRVLVVDDDPVVRELVTRIIRGLAPETEIAQAGDGYEASLLIGSSLPDLVVLDVVMPRLDGLTLCRSIRRNPETRSIKVLAITAHPQGETVDAMFAAGADACLIKPLRFDEFRRELYRLLQDVSGPPLSNVESR